MYKLRCLLLTLCFSSTQIIFAAETAATTPKTAEQNIADQKSKCDKNSAMEWSLKLGRCIGKQAAFDTRNDAKACNAIADIPQREKCHLALAEKNTGLSGDVSKLSEGNLGKSAIMNGVGSAYAILGMINSFGSGKKESVCTSKKIFGYTALAGTATDIWLKIRARKKMDELAQKYKLDTANSPYESQVRALYYLKEEQKTVAEIAGDEKKRNMLLILGYGAATAMAIYEWAVPTLNSQCYAKEPDADKPKPETAQVTQQADACTTTTNANCAAAPAPAPAQPQNAAAQTNPVAGQQGEIVSNNLEADPIAPAVVANPAIQAEASSGVTLNKSVSSSGVVRVEIPNDINNGGRTTAIVGSNVIDMQKGNVIGTIDTKSVNPTITYYSNPGQDGPKVLNISGVSSTKPGGAFVSMDGSSLRGQGLDYSSKYDAPATKVIFGDKTAPTGTTVKGSTLIINKKGPGK